MDLGLWLYDIFARTAWSERHRVLSSAATLEREPALAADNLTGAALYYDAGRMMRASPSKTSSMRDCTARRCELSRRSKASRRMRDRIVSAHVRDVINDKRFEVRARHFVNAAGPWVDDIRKLDDPASKPSVRLTKGGIWSFRARVASEGADCARR